MYSWQNNKPSNCLIEVGLKAIFSSTTIEEKSPIPMSLHSVFSHKIGKGKLTGGR